MKAPPLLPEIVFQRVLRVARFDGLSVAVLAGFFALASASAHDVPGALVGLAIAGAGAMELHGASRLSHGAADGMRWLIASQLGVMAVILGYAGWRLGHPDPLLLEAFKAGLKDEQRQQLKEVGLTEAEFVRVGSRMVYCCVGLATLLYQSGMAIYYARRRRAVEQAIEDDAPQAP
ncbi:MAG: hypothetical protein HZA93_20765 [Verrucomicrobia bacterium]|nr:hypothetical protein [Verrucomicrobiota bacterium]